MDVKDYEKYAKARNQERWECRKAKKIFERTLAKGAIQVLRNAIFLEIGPPPTPS